MPKPKRIDLGKLLRIPSRKSRPAREVRRCEACKGPLVLMRGYGYCENCLQTTPLPVGRVLSRGRLHGKHIYLKSAILRELREDYDLRDVDEAFEGELEDTNHIIIEEFEKED